MFTKIKMLLVFSVWCHTSMYAQKNLNSLIKEIWQADSCTISSHRDILSSFIVKNRLICNSEDLKNLLGNPLHINYRKNGNKYYIYVDDAANNHFYDCNILSIVAFKFDKKDKLCDEDIYYFIGDAEDEHTYWNSKDLPKVSYQGDGKEPYPFNKI